MNIYFSLSRMLRIQILPRIPFIDKDDDDFEIFRDDRTGININYDIDPYEYYWQVNHKC